MKRSTYQQIIDWKQRRGEHPRLAVELLWKIGSLESEWNRVGASDSIFLDFIPIRLVTILEVFLREAISELVNIGEPYFGRAEKLTKGAKIDLAFAAHVDRGDLTIGDFIAQAVSLNSAEAAISSLDALIDNFVPKLKSAYPRWSEEIESWPLPPIITEYDATIAALSRLYVARHILTHELPANRTFEPAEVPVFISSCRAFVEAADWLIVECVHGSVPRSQLGMNLQAGQGLSGEQARLEKAVEKAKSLRGMDPVAFDAMQNDWDGFADAQAKLVASQVAGGSMYPMIWASEKEELVKDRIEQLARICRDWMDK